MGIPKPHMAESILKIRQIYMNDWDPIGVHYMEGCSQDEYDAYIYPVYGILRQSRSKEAIIDYLHRIETDHIGMPHPIERLEPIADALLQIDVSHDEPQG